MTTTETLQTAPSRRAPRPRRAPVTYIEHTPQESLTERIVMAILWTGMTGFYALLIALYVTGNAG